MGRLRTGVSVSSKAALITGCSSGIGHATAQRLLQERWTVYATARRSQTLADLARPSLITAVSVVILGLLIAIPKDVQWSRSRRHGRRLKGPELVSARRFNRRTRANGIRFVQTRRLPARVLGVRPVLKIPRAIESSHLLVMGDSGTGKSALIRQILQQLEDRGETAIVYDPALGYTPQFYMPERDDVILMRDPFRA